jgi:hypothetical protein
MEKKSKAKSILKRKSPELLTSCASCQTFTKTVMNARHVNSVVMKYSSVALHCVQMGDWIRCQKYDTWHREVPIVAIDRKQFISEKCL